MEFTFDLSQTPVIGRRQRPSLSHAQSTALSSTASSMYGSYSVASTATLTSAMAAAASDAASEKESIGKPLFWHQTKRDVSNFLIVQLIFYLFSESFLFELQGLFIYWVYRNQLFQFRVQDCGKPKSLIKSFRDS